MVSTRSTRQAASSTVVTASSDKEGPAAYSSATSKSSSSIEPSSSAESCPIPTRGVSRESSSHTRIMTRKRRLIQEAEAHLAMGVSLYWEGGIDRGRSGRDDEEGADNGTPRRSRRGENGGARRRHETVAGLLGDGERIAGTLPPMVSTKEGTLLAVEVFGEDVLDRLPAVDKGPRVGHCSSGYVCGHPVPRGKEGNLWCQTPVRASLEGRMACMHHLHRRVGAGGPSKEQSRYMLLADEFYDQKGDISWLRVVSHLRAHPSTPERRHRRQVIAACGRCLAVSDVKIVLHGFVQCTLFWLAACRLARRGYRFTVVAHASKAAIKEFLAGLRQKSAAAVPPPSRTSSPFVCVNDVSSRNVCYYAFGSDQLCRMF